MTKSNRKAHWGRDAKTALTAASLEALGLAKKVEAALRRSEAKANEAGANWGHVGDAKHAAAQLSEILAQLEGTDEYDLQACLDS